MLLWLWNVIVNRRATSSIGFFLRGNEPIGLLASEHRPRTVSCVKFCDSYNFLTGKRLWIVRVIFKAVLRNLESNYFRINIIGELRCYTFR
ncbi:hypothetical protein WKI72_23035 (plasmid) [Candidatus Erwinia dacicola]|uniref:Uncharacterized protein n=1 Tax=Candidatus Erwinia dacicola TaxID=252393 RepID=A0A1E7Z1H7_9GAMM|nr:hypothetical protein [Candidatus Erwinia dacicola]OFC62591.1 hypothetical protein BBW68_09025 [Candidatus Erwinia dacicola]